ncbi:AAA domain-containing protein [Pseudoclavibacter sp. CFCC 14310]|uniref:AAA domain-containing protein n=1 Tax=Pseudoclavibacter sp. CFCC 14310 TaxID=2615180 RepID=UPI001CE3BA02|nr:AAA domain-containing protein [Pseudoclavibacter sp. CFCC 14310]
MRAEDLLRGAAALRVLQTVAPQTLADDWFAAIEAEPSGVAGFTSQSLESWLVVLRDLAALDQPATREFREDLLEGRRSPDEASSVFRSAVNAATITERLATHRFGDLPGEAHDQRIHHYQRMIDRLRRQVPEQVRQEILRDRSIVDDARLGELRRELNRKRGGMGIRQLFSRYADLIVQITPCVLVSPESVARFIPPRADQFDLVVFDEASQVRVADAIGAIGRGRSAVIVGDSKQMPPTSYMEVRNNRDDLDLNEIDDVVEDQESILDECANAGVERRSLEWHYRSEDESLIAFSNAHYYNGNLTSFPSPQTGRQQEDGSRTGIHLIRVNGEFLREPSEKSLKRTNPVEADEIVRLVQRRFEASEGQIPSIGIVTFNVQQRDLIDERLRALDDDRITEALDQSDEGLFVKNLENVQGDERDTIVFSTAFSCEPDGRLRLNFGPLTLKGGERRLNVAVTRARREVTVVTSFDPEDIDLDRTSSQGLRDLRNYMLFARVGGAGDQADALIDRRKRDDPHRDQIANQLRLDGYAVSTDVGLSEQFRLDLVIARPEAPDKPVAAVLLDGVSWARRPTVADRDLLPITVLQDRLKWPVVLRVWLPDWIRDPEAEILRLEQAIANAQSSVVAEAEHVTVGGGVADADDVDFSVDEADQLREPEAAEQREPAESVLSSEGLTAVRAFSTKAAIEAEEASPQESQFVARAADGASSAGLPQPGLLGHSSDAVDAAWQRPSSIDQVRAIDVTHWNPFETGHEFYSHAELLESERGWKRLRPYLHRLLSVEGPIPMAKAIPKLGSGLGLERVKGSRRQSMIGFLRSEAYLDADEMLWCSKEDSRMHRTARRYLLFNEWSFDDISLPEVAVALILSSQNRRLKLTDEQTMRGALRFFGGERLTQRARERMQAAARLLEHQ